MCSLLNIRFHPVTKRNHNDFAVERLHQFLNHSQRICSEEPGTSTVFAEYGITTVYAWNASPIDGTNIIRSITAIDRVLKFLSHIHEYPLPTPIDSPTQSIIEYII